ncbi:MAG: hypothetical protein GY928_14715 [Colwellia sp.]|nr:hypothetical protein [Colwellia sp.]
MKEFKGTKGKWNYDLSEDGTLIMSDNKVIVRIIDECEEPDGVPMEEGIYNAKLMSAAPELLKALQGIARDFEGDYVISDGSIVDNPGQMLITNYYICNEAINKALGNE